MENMLHLLFGGTHLYLIISLAYSNGFCMGSRFSAIHVLNCQQVAGILISPYLRQSKVSAGVVNCPNRIIVSEDSIEPQETARNSRLPG